MLRSKSAYWRPSDLRHPYFETPLEAQRRPLEPLNDLIRECAEFDALRGRLASSRVLETGWRE